jgi:hypothetical protein
MQPIVVYGSIGGILHPHRFRGVAMTVGRSAWSRLSTRRGRLLAVILAAVAASTFASVPAVAAPRPQAPAAVEVAAPPSAKPAVVTQPAVRVDMCGGALPFGQIAVCSSITGTEQHVYTLTVTQASDILATQLTRGSGELPASMITGPDGGVACRPVGQASTCELGAAGTYTITVFLNFGGTGNYTLAVESMRTPSACTTLPSSFFSWASPGLTATLAAGAAAHCYQFNQPAGAVLYIADPLAAEPTDVRGEIRDAQYQSVCPVQSTNVCALSQPGPYRLFMTETFGAEANYALRMPRLSNSVGCPKLKLAKFGDPAPDGIGTGATANSSDAACHKLTDVGPGPVVVRINPATVGLDWTLYDDAGQEVCNNSTALLSCDLPQKVDYTLVVVNGESTGRVAYQVAVTALYRSAGCAFPTGTSWDLPTLSVHPNTAVSTHCQPFFGRAGDRIVHYGAPVVFNDLRKWLVDQNGATVCSTSTPGQDGCVLPATGIYRLVSFLNQWDPAADPTYKLQIRRLSDPSGCPVVRPGTYGAAPVSPLGTNRCRILDIAAAGSYRVKAVDANNVTVSGQVYDAAGLRKSCSSICDFTTPGRYTFIAGSRLIEEVRFALALLPAGPSTEAGCVPVSDAGLTEAAHRGQFTSAGQINCLQVVSSPRAVIVQLLPGEPTGAGRPVVNIVNGGGISVCDANALRRRSCAVNSSGVAFVILVAPEGTPSGPYAMAFARVDGPPACQNLPSGADGATVATTADRFSACLSIPTDGHAAQEVFSYQRTSGTGNAIISVFNAAGTRICGPTAPAADRTVTCNLPAGPVTVILEADAADATYRLTRTG